MRRALLLVVAIVVLLLPVPAHAAVETGVVATLPFTARDAQNVRDLNAKTVRFFMFTNTDPSVFDEAVRLVNSAGAKPFFVVVGDTGNPPRSPGDIAAYASFLSRAVTHFKGQTAGWEVWNEPDGPRFWSGQPPFDADHTNRDASEYARLLHAAHDAIKAADPSALVVSAGLTGNDYSFLKSLYDNGAKNDFDVVGIHTDTACAIASPYDYLRDSPGGPINQFSWLGLFSIRAVMQQFGDDAKPVWLTEVGWSSYTGTCQDGAGAGTKAAGVGEANQGAFLSQAMHCVRVRNMDWLTKAFVFVLNEADDPDPMNTGYGMVRKDGGRKSAFEAWRGYATSGDQLPDSEACGDFEAPALQISAPASGALFAGSLPITVSAQDPSGVGRITLSFDGKDDIRSFGDASAPSTLNGALDWQGAKQLSLGAHHIDAIAIDTHGNVSTARVDVTKVDPGKLPLISTKSTARLSGRGGRRTLSIRLKAAKAGLTTLRGKIDVIAQKRKKRKWVSAHRYSKSAKGADKKALAFHLKLEKAQWRIIVRFRPSQGTSYKGFTRTLKAFTVR